MSFVETVLNNGGAIMPLIVPSEFTNGTGLFNPSVYNDDGNLILNLRHCQYTFYHSEKKMFEHEYGPLLYLNPENDISLTTTNYFCRLDSDDYHIKSSTKIDTSSLDVKPIWDFIGLEDARLFRWEGKLYTCGVRRDTTPNGQGRMELSEILCIPDANGVDHVAEMSRFRIPAPAPDNTYCEKNWMPILDKPYHFVKWSNPTEIVEVNVYDGTCKTVFMGRPIPDTLDYRGGSQVIRLGDWYVCLVHTVRLFNSQAGKKDAIYRHAFIVWDLDFKLIKYTKEFSFMNADVEFSCGMAEYNGDILMTFGYQDNAAYLLSAPKQFIIDYIKEDKGE